MQLNALRKFGCEKIFSEKVSGAKADRPALNRMISHLREGDEIVVYKLDRLGRSLPDLVKLVDTFKEKGVLFHSLTDSISIDDSAIGQMMFNIFAAFAQFERDLISERTRAGLAAAKARGRKGGRPKGLSKKSQYKVAAAKKLHEAGTPPNDIASILEISRSTVYRYLER